MGELTHLKLSFSEVGGGGLLLGIVFKWMYIVSSLRVDYSFSPIWKLLQSEVSGSDSELLSIPFH